MSVNFTARIVYGCPISYEEYNKLTDDEKDEYVYWIDCYSDAEDATLMLGLPIMSCDPGEIKRISEKVDCEKEEKANIFYICDKYNIDTKSIGYYLANRVS